jgi:uncharacterized phage protein gp47/JayE
VADFGVTQDGFTIKGFDVILGAALDRARQAFGSSVDLAATSPLRKLLEVSAAEDAELWKQMEELYYGNFLSTAVGASLDLLGEDLGVPRRQLFAGGQVRLTLANAVPGRSYSVQAGAVVVTAPPIVAFYTTRAVTLDASRTQDVVDVLAFERGPAGNVAAGAVVDLDPGYLQAYLDLGPATLTVTNAAAFSGGEQTEGDEGYRSRLVGFPRNMWTAESIQAAAAGAEGVIDVIVFDPLGGVDVSQSYFNLFGFAERLFSGGRRLGEPYFFSVVVAHETQWPWRAQGPVRGIFEQVLERVDAVRPVGIYPLVVEADHIEVGVSATVVVRAGFDVDAVLASIRAAIAANVAALRLGGDVLHSQVVRAFVEQPGVLDVQNLRLLRCSPAFGRITFGNVPYQTGTVELACGENLTMGPTEIAIFRVDGDLSAIEVVTR